MGLANCQSTLDDWYSLIFIAQEILSTLVAWQKLHATCSFFSVASCLHTAETRTCTCSKDGWNNLRAFMCLNHVPTRLNHNCEVHVYPTSKKFITPTGNTGACTCISDLYSRWRLWYLPQEGYKFIYTCTCNYKSQPPPHMCTSKLCALKMSRNFLHGFCHYDDLQRQLK